MLTMNVGADQIRDAGLIARVVELRDVRLRSLDAELVADHQVILESVCELGVRAESTYQFDDKSQGLLVNVAAIVSMTSVGKEDSKERPGDQGAPLLRIEAGFELEYHLAESPPVEDRDRLLSAFASVNGAYNAWPYLREIVQSVVSRMGLPPLTLPVFRVANASAQPKLRLVAGKTS